MHKLTVTTWLLFSALLSVFQDLKAQTLPFIFDHYRVEDGLSMNMVTDILQDHKGFMWFGTREGLNCWDGYRFRVYKPDSQDPHSLNNGLINGIYEDSENHLWILTWAGLVLFDRPLDKFIPCNFGITEEERITGLFEDGKHDFWIATSGGGLKLLNRTDSSFVSYLACEDETENAIYVVSMYEDWSGLFWIGTTGGLYQFDREIGTFENHRFRDLAGGIITDEAFFSIYQDFKGHYWLAGRGWNGLSRYDPEKGTLTKFRHDPRDKHSLSDDRLSTICEDHDKNLWIGTANGLNLYDRTNDRFIHFQNNTNDAYSISSNHIKHIYADRDGNVWIGTMGGGINFIRGHRKPFENYTHETDDQNSLSHPNVTSFYERKDGKIWIGTKGGGLNLFDPNRNTFTRYDIEARSKNVVIRNEVADDILEDRNGDLWIVAGTMAGEGGLHKYRLSGNGQRLTYLPGEIPGNLANQTIFTIYGDKKGEIWIGRPDGLSRFNPETGILLNYQRDEKLGGTYYVFEDSRENIWAGTRNGLFLFNRENDSFTAHRNHTVYGIMEDLQGHIITFEEGQVAYRYDLKNDSSTVFYDGTQHPPSVGSLRDDAGFFWFTTRSGIIKFDPVTGVVKKYDASDGLISNEFNAHAQLKSTSGALYFGSSDGFCVFYPDSIKDNPSIPPVVITDFQLFNRTVPVSGTFADTSDGGSPLKQSISYATEIALTHKQNIFSFEFAALNYISPEKNQYRYKLEGFNKDWINTDASRRFATYTNLDPGIYTFMVQGSNDDGIWNETGASIHLKILPPPWRTWWAYALYSLALAGLLFGSIRFVLVRQYLKGKLKLEQMELKKIQELDQMKTRFFANISHEFRTPLTLILGPLKQILEREPRHGNRKILTMIERNVKRLLFLINQLLDFSKLEAGHLPLQAAGYDIVEFLRKMFASFESMARTRDINYVFQSDTGTLMVYFDRDKLEKVTINLITNAFKFTLDGGDIHIRLNKEASNPEVDKGEGIVQIQVEDTGIGIPEEKLPYIFDRFYQVHGSGSRLHEGTGIGLALAKDLVDLHHGSLTVTSRKGSGSVFTLQLPLGKGHLSQNELLMDTEKSPDLVYEDYADVGDKTAVVKKHKNVEDRLLIIDDNPDMRAYIREVLMRDFDIEEAVDGEEGLSSAFEHLPDLIITDVMMPGMDGNELCRKLKTDERTSHIPVVMLTAKAGESARLEGFETGADDYITKPFSPVELRIRVLNIIDQRKKLRERFSRDITLQPRDLAITSADERFLDRAMNILKEKSSDSEFSAVQFSKDMAMSRAQLHRKLKALTGQSAREFIRSYRLNHARRLLEGRFGNMAEIAFESGFSNPSYFAMCFKKQFGVLPSKYINRIAGDTEV